jgi:hypothetical protein
LSVATGWNNIYLGTDLNSNDLVQASKASNCSCVILSILYPLDDESLGLELKKLRKGLGDDVEIVINGKKSNLYSETYKDINAKVVHDLFSMPTFLEDLKSKFIC